MAKTPLDPPPAYLARPGDRNPSSSPNEITRSRPSVELDQPSPNHQMIYAISVLPPSGGITRACRDGLYRVSADSTRRWASDDREIDAAWAKAEKRMEEVVKKFAYSQNNLDRERLLRGRVQKPILEMEVMWQGLMRRERAKKDEECKALIAEIEHHQGGDPEDIGCCSSQADIEAAKMRSHELGIASIQTVDAWSRTWDENLQKRRDLWEEQKRKWERDMTVIVDGMMAGSPSRS